MSAPVPAHLTHLLTVTGSDGWLTGKIACPCGHEWGKLRVVADVVNGGRLLRTKETESGFFLRVEWVCAHCGESHLLFDRGLHGYDGFVCGDGERAPAELLEEFVCPQCGGPFSAELALEVFDREEWSEEVSDDDRFSDEDYVNAFGWITLSLTCQSCGRSLERILDLETM